MLESTGAQNIAEVQGQLLTPARVVRRARTMRMSLIQTPGVSSVLPAPIRQEEKLAAPNVPEDTTALLVPRCT